MTGTIDRSLVDDDSLEQLLPEKWPERRAALLHLLALLKPLNYDFIAPTPASQARVLARADRQVGHGVVDLLGWSLPCRVESILPDIVSAFERAGLLERRQLCSPLPSVRRASRPEPRSNGTD